MGGRQEDSLPGRRFVVPMVDIPYFASSAIASCVVVQAAAKSVCRNGFPFVETDHGVVGTRHTLQKPLVSPCPREQAAVVERLPRRQTKPAICLWRIGLKLCVFFLLKWPIRGTHSRNTVFRQLKHSRLRGCSGGGGVWAGRAELVLRY